MSNATKMFMAVMVAALFATGCTLTRQEKKVKTSGFLKDYSQLRKGYGDQALLVYVNSKTQFSDYDKIMIDSVTIWRDDDSNLAKVPQEDLQQLADDLHRALATALGKNYKLVQEPGPGVMRLRAALSEAEGSWIVMDTVSTVIPIGRAIAEGKYLVTGTASFVGKAAIEVEILDSLTNERLAAAADARSGGKVLRGTLEKWDDVEEAFKYWAERLRRRLVGY